MIKKVFLYNLFLLLILPHQLFAEKVYLSYQDALKLFFANSNEVKKEKKVISQKEKEDLKKILGYEPEMPVYNFYLGLSGTKIDGYAIIDHEVGKVSPITFITHISPEGKILQMEVMVYREAHGGEVAQKRFTAQFKNHGYPETLRIGSPIKNITGATLSSRAMVKGANRALVLWKYFYGKN